MRKTKLKTYLAGRTRGAKAELARRIGVSAAYIGQLLVHPGEVFVIEESRGGVKLVWIEVRRSHLRLIGKDVKVEPR